MDVLGPTVAGSSRQLRWLLALSGLTGLAGAGLAAAGVQSAVRTILVLVFLATGPTAAIAGLLPRLDGLARLVVSFTAGMVLIALVAIVMLAEGLWSPVGGLWAVVAIVAGCALVQVPALRRAVTSAVTRRPPSPEASDEQVIDSR